MAEGFQLKLNVVCKICVAEQYSYTLVGVTRNSCHVIVRLACDVRFISEGRKAAQTFCSVMSVSP